MSKSGRHQGLMVKVVLLHGFPVHLFPSHLCRLSSLSPLLSVPNDVSSINCMESNFKFIRQNTKSARQTCVSVFVCGSSLMKFLGCWVFSSHTQTVPCWARISRFMCLRLSFFYAVHVFTQTQTRIDFCSVSNTTHKVDWLCSLIVFSSSFLLHVCPYLILMTHSSNTLDWCYCCFWPYQTDWDLTDQQ